MSLNIKYQISNIISILIALIVFSALSNKIYAAQFTLDPTTRTVAPGEEFSVDLKIDSGAENITSADALLKFDSTILKIDSVTPGTFFPQNFKAISASQVYIGGAVQNASENRSGKGLLATINLSAIGSGVSELAFDCTPGKTSDSNITKDDKNATDILNCEQLVDGSYTVSGSVTGKQPTPTPKKLPKAGNIGNTLIIAGAGLLLTIAGLLVML